jgi:MFS family permease
LVFSSSRPCSPAGYAGRLTDHFGGKRSALQGAGVCALGGLLYLVSAAPGLAPTASLAIVIVGRLVAGFGESQLVTGCVSWSIASVGPQRAGMSMSWTGIAMFAALAIGAPIGMALYQRYGLQAAMVACIVAPLIAGGVALRQISFSSPAGQRLPFYKVIGQIWREGLGLMLQGVGLSGLTAFASLFFVARHWGHAGLVMTAFGVGFIFVRIALGHLTDKMSGYRVALLSLAVEAIGQAMLWLAPSEIVALAGALVTGLGCALVFPALGVEALNASSRPTAAARWARSSPSSTSPTASPVPSRALSPDSSAMPPSTCWAPPAPCLARPSSSRPVVLSPDHAPAGSRVYADEVG